MTCTHSVQDEVNTSSKSTKLDTSKLLKMDSKDVVQKAQQEMHEVVGDGAAFLNLTVSPYT